MDCRATNLVTMKVAVVIVACLLVIEPLIGQPKGGDAVWQKAKELEGIFPLPIPQSDFDMGTLDVRNHRWQGFLSGTAMSAEVLDRMPNNDAYDGTDTQTQTEPPIVGATFNSVYVPLRFSFTFNGGQKIQVRVKTAGQTYNPPAIYGNGSIVVSLKENVGPVTDWDIWTSDRHYHGRLGLSRKTDIVGVGAFKMPYLPIAVVYAPTALSGRTATARWSATSAYGTSVGIALGSASSATTSIDAAALSGLGSMMQKISGAANLIPVYGSAAAVGLAALGGLLKGFGSETFSTTTGNSNSEFTITNSSFAATCTVRTAADHPRGLGYADVLVYLKDCRFIWFTENGKFYVSCLDHSLPQFATVEDLDAASDGAMKALAGLDPLTGNSGASLDAERFYYKGTQDFTVGTQTYGIEVSSGEVDGVTRAGFTSTVHEMREGALSFLGLGVPATEAVTSTSSYSVSYQSSNQQTYSSNVIVETPYGSGPVTYDVYFDKLFKTFIFRWHNPFGGPLLMGTLSDVHTLLNGPTSDTLVWGRVSYLRPPGPAKKRQVEVRIGKLSFFTLTDGTGLYLVRATPLSSRRVVTVRVDKTEVQAELNAGLPTRVDLLIPR